MTATNPPRRYHAPVWLEPGVMELGATVCLPRSPLCSQCPAAGDCQTRGEHETLPRAPAPMSVTRAASILRCPSSPMGVNRI